MNIIQNRLTWIYYTIYAVFIVGIVIAHFCPWYFYKFYGTKAIVTGYIDLGILLVFIPTAIGLYNHQIKKKVNLDYYFKWNVIQMSIMAFTGVIAIFGYSLLRDKSSLFAYLIVFIALILTKPTKYKIQKYLGETNNEV
ncbi:MAG: hypothetical protein MJ003_00310 [Paludibacteraceae bacterium]|nr:hypothetical protein [Paludibacteraceae bacterium]